MTVRRGDVVLVHYPFSSGKGGKLRPALVVQNDRNNRRLSNVILAAITTRTRHSGEPTHLLVDPSLAEGVGSGLRLVSCITCENLATIEKSPIVKRLGALQPFVMQRVAECLKNSLELP